MVLGWEVSTDWKSNSKTHTFIDLSRLIKFQKSLSSLKIHKLSAFHKIQDSESLSRPDITHTSRNISSVIRVKSVEEVVWMDEERIWRVIAASIVLLDTAMSHQETSMHPGLDALCRHLTRTSFLHTYLPAASKNIKFIVPLLGSIIGYQLEAHLPWPEATTLQLTSTLSCT